MAKGRKLRMSLKIQIVDAPLQFQQVHIKGRVRKAVPTSENYGMRHQIDPPHVDGQVRPLHRRGKPTKVAVEVDRDEDIQKR